MQNQYSTHILVAFSTLVIAITSAFLTYYLKNRNDIKKHKRELEKQRINLANENKKTLFELTNSEASKIFYNLSALESSVSLTSSVIDSSRSLSLEQFDLWYRGTLDHVHIIKASINSNFHECYNLIKIIEASFNNYWGLQRILLLIDVKTENERFGPQQQEVIKICNDFSKVTEDLRREIQTILKKHPVPTQELLIN